MQGYLTRANGRERLPRLDKLGGAGVNYVPLALYARLLSKPGALEAELVDVLDLPRELRKAGAQQFWIAVPFAVAIAALATEV